MRFIMAKRLNDCSGEVIEKNFLNEEIDKNEIHSDEKVVVCNQMPKFEKIVFMNLRDPGQPLYFHYKTKTHPLKQYKLLHGQTYELPIEVIKHLEGMGENDPYSCHKRTYSNRELPDGSYENYASGYVAYFQCRSVR